MTLQRYITLILTLVLVGAAHAATTQIGSLALQPTVTTSTYFDPNTGTLNTQSVSGAPVQVSSSFIGYTQNPGGSSPDPTTDIGLHTYSSSTFIYQLSRYASTSAAGAVQWSFDLTPLDTYLSANNLAASALNLQLNTSQNNEPLTYDVYLSYTSASEGMTLTPLDTTASGNYTDFFTPGNAASVGTVVNGAFKVEAQNAGGGDVTYGDTIDLLSLYNSGIKQFNLMLVSASYGYTSSINIPNTSGIYLDTTAVPEPSTAMLLCGLGLLGLLPRRRCA